MNVHDHTNCQRCQTARAKGWVHPSEQPTGHDRVPLDPPATWSDPQADLWLQQEDLT